MADLQKTAASLEKHGFTVRIFSTAEEAKSAALELIGSASVGFGGSVTLDALGLYEDLTARGNSVFFAWKTPLSADPDIYKKAIFADVYLSSANAVTEDGALVNIDGRGNRVAALTFGPGRVIVITGRNKIVPDLHSALRRVRGHAAGLNARRLGAKTPCAVDLQCHDCDCPARICRTTMIIDRKPLGFEHYDIFLVDEDLGM